MQKSLISFLFVVLSSVPAGALAQDARAILDMSRQKQLERWAGVDSYLVDQTVSGHAVQTLFQRTEITTEAGDTETMFLPVRNAAAQVGRCEGTRSMTADELEIFAQGLELGGTVIGIRQDEQRADAGLPPELFQGDPSEPWASPDPRHMLGAGAQMMRGAAEAQRAQEAENPGAEVQQRVDQITRFIETAKLVGTETVDGRRAWHLRASDLEDVHEADDSEFRTEAMSMWIDTAELVPLRIRMDGTMTSGRQTKPMSVDLIHSDYRRVPGSDMYESHRQVTRLSGMLDDKQQKELQEAQQQLAEFEQQMADMPPDQRAMMERMVGPRLEQFRRMAATGSFESEIVTHAITVNPTATGPDGELCSDERMAAMPKEDEPSASLEEWETGLTAMIQRDLLKLGYAPGNTDGVMDKQTAVAISQFQAAKNLEVTGQPSPQLAGIIAADANPEPAQ